MTSLPGAGGPAAAPEGPAESTAELAGIAIGMLTAAGQTVAAAESLWHARELALPAAHEPVTSARAYGRDPYLDGLWCARGAQVQPLPAVIEEVLAAPTRLSVSIVELAELLTLDPAASLGDALAACDARWLAPAVRLVERGAVQQVAVVANDRCLSLQRYDHLKRWRRARRGLAGLA